MKQVLLIAFTFISSFANAQPQSIFMSQMTTLQFAHSTDIKGKFVSEDADGSATYVCEKPLLGFTTLLVKSGSKMMVRAVSNDQAPFPPMLEKVLDQMTKTATILGIVRKDSDTDFGLKAHLTKFSKIKRIISFTKTGETRAVLFYENHESEYFIDIILGD